MLTHMEKDNLIVQKKSTNIFPKDGSFDLDKVKFDKLLGAGGFGSVFSGTFKGRKIAVKKFHTNVKNKKAAMQSYEAETSATVLGFDHPNIVKTLAVSVCTSLEQEPFIIMEFISKTTLQQLLDNPNEKIDFTRRVRFTTEIADALAYVHERNLAHLDLKPANVLMTESGVCKLADFGCAQTIEENPVTPTRSLLTGTFAYRAPELLKGELPTDKADIYALGICMWQFVSREIPYKSQNHQVVIFGVVAKRLRPKLPVDVIIEDKYRILMQLCWHADAKLRPGAMEMTKDLKNWNN